MRRALLPILAAVLTLAGAGCQEITPPRIARLQETRLTGKEAREFALQRIRLGDLHLLAGYYDLAFANYWAAYRRDNSDFTPGSWDDVQALTRALELPPDVQLGGPSFGHSTVARIAMALELQGKYRLLGLLLEYFASGDQAGSIENAINYLVAAGYYYHLGGLDKYALPPLKKAVSISSNNLNAYENLARVSESLGDLEAALSYWRIIVVIANQLDPTDKDQGAEQAYYLQTAGASITRLEPLVEGEKMIKGRGGSTRPRAPR
ncbi:MAG TPA: hypothetical protein VEI97_07635 [bacterium]|nr:hypothetical protein [bacterium]